MLKLFHLYEFYNYYLDYIKIRFLSIFTLVLLNRYNLLHAVVHVP
jgi:hypothetical protein